MNPPRRIYFFQVQSSTPPAAFLALDRRETDKPFSRTNPVEREEYRPVSTAVLKASEIRPSLTWTRSPKRQGATRPCNLAAPRFEQSGAGLARCLGGIDNCRV